MVIPHPALAHFPLPRPLLLPHQSVEESRPLATAPPRATAPMVGSDSACLASVGVGKVVALVLTICEIE